MKKNYALAKWLCFVLILAAPMMMQAQDVGVKAILSPGEKECVNSAQYFKVLIYNYGSTSQTNIPVKLSVTGSSSLSSSYTYTKTLGPNSQDTVIFPNTLYTSAGNSLTIKAFTDLSTDVNRGNDAATVNTDIEGYPTADFTFSDICVGKEITFQDASTVPGNIYFSRDWDFGDGGSSKVTYPTHTYAKAGTYNVTLKVGTGAGCKDQITKQVKVYEKPKLGFMTSSLCVGETITFIDTTVTEGKVATYYWQFSPTAWSKSASPTYKFIKPGKTTVLMAVTTTTGCTDTLRKEIEIVPRPSPSFTATMNCLNEVSTFVNTTPNDTVFDFYWDFGDGTYSTEKSPTKIFYVAGDYTISLTAKAGSSGCEETITKKVSPFKTPIAKIEYAASCVGSATTFTDKSDYANSSPTSIKWYFGDGETDTKSTPSHTYAKPGIYTVSLAIRNANGCHDSTSIAITVKPLPTADFSANVVCVGQATAFTNKSTGSGGTMTYDWNYGDSSAHSTAKSPTHVYAKPGTYTATLKVDDGGCISTKSVQVTVNPGPTPDFKYTNTGKKVNFTTADGTFASYQWAFGDGDSSTAQNPMHLYPSATGTYKVTLIVKDDKGCVGMVIKDIDLSTSITENAELNPWKVQVFPNPFNGNSKVSFTLAQKSLVKVSLTDLQGREILQVQNAKNLSAGSHEMSIDGSHLPKGVYILRMIIGDQVYNTSVIQQK